MSEQKIQAAIRKWLEDRGVYVVKVITANRAGVPDLVCCINGTFVGIEVKQPGKKPSPLQLAHLQQIRDAGGDGWIATSVSEIKQAYTLLNQNCPPKH